MLKRASISDTKDETDERLDLPVSAGDWTSERLEYIALGVVPPWRGLMGVWEVGVFGLKDELFLCADAGNRGGPIVPTPPLEEPVR